MLPQARSDFESAPSGSGRGAAWWCTASSIMPQAKSASV